MERIEVDHELVLADRKLHHLDRLHGPAAQQAHGIVGDADDPAGLHDLAVLVGEGLEVLLDVLGVLLGRLELDMENVAVEGI